eukprot:Blabericola_migrator_1__5780@NODE_292_length_10275_cov_168_705525_g240_i0_p1_GENE_NODE_292_length_10275_cov_168_705525_g240_i0NODE_292_length_10275_cov_168_705525_g240_i0_p1_ORF_typecomplete_len576_score123_29Na_H_Exchanger/PF00999_21/9_2e63Smim3/PF17307_2/0_12PsaL/PF02605_15/1_7PsaL/PF02605_15/3_9e02_NODE_292_length_10275_cov_168_705525_g240_i08262553
MRLPILIATTFILAAANVFVEVSEAAHDEDVMLNEALPVEALPTREEQEIAFSNGVLLLLTLCLLAMALGYQLSTRVHRSVNTPTVAIVLGFISGIIIKFLIGTETEFVLKNVLAFNEKIFFVFLLPPIIFASGFTLNESKGSLFFQRFGTILWFALFATFISFLVGSTGLWLSGVFAFSTPLRFQEALLLGAILSPTDAVTVLSIFRDLVIDPVTETVVMGESLLNDAVAIVLYRIIMHPARSEYHGLLHETAGFCWLFFVSMVMGWMMCLLLSLITKLTTLRWFCESTETVNSAETAVILVSPWLTYLLAEKMGLSGVVAVLFCGIGIARYTLPNFTSTGAATARNVYESFSTLAETLVFVLLGLAVFCFPSLNSAASTARFIQNMNLHWVTLVIVSLARLLSIYGTAGIVNLLLRNAHRKSQLSASFKAVLALSGLRGAVTVALALQAKSDLGNEIGAPLLSACLFYTIFTIIILGPALPMLYHFITTLADEGDMIVEVDAPPHVDDQPAHLLIWRYLIFGVRKLDTIVFNFVTKWSSDGGFYGDEESPVLETMDMDPIGLKHADVVRAESF